MNLQHGDIRRPWEPGPRVKAAWGRALDLIFPPQALDRGARPQSTGLSADAWSRVRFIAEPLCDGCGQPMILIMKPSKPRCPVSALNRP